MILGLPLLWLLTEWLRTWFLTGFPWLLIGYSQTDTPLAALAPVGGVLLVSLVLALLAGLLAAWLLKPGPRRMSAFLAGLLAVWLLNFALPRDWTEPQGEPLSVALVQGNIGQDLKWDPAYRIATIERYRELTLPYLGVDLIVWPEAAVPTFYQAAAEQYLLPLRDEALRHGSELLIGVPTIDLATERFYNSVVALGAGEPQAYHKRHLVPFGEYLPLRDWFGNAFDLLGAPMSDFDRGSDPSPLTVAGERVGVTICYEAVFGPEFAAALPEATLLVNVSNDAWFGDSLAPHQHLQMARWRALETGRSMLRATNTGITAIIGADGKLQASIPQFTTDVLRGEVQPRTGATPYVRWLDTPVLVLMFGGLAALWLLRRRSRPVVGPASAGLD